MDPRLVFLFLAGIVGAAVAAPCLGCPEVKTGDDLETILFLRYLLINNTVPAKGTLGGETVEFVKLSNTTTQVVAGIKYVFEFDARGNETQKVYDCQLSVVVQSWLNKTTVGDYSCTLRSMLDEVEGVTAESIENLEELKELIVSELTKKQKPKNPLAITKVLNAHRQLVSGFLTQLTVEVAETVGQGRQVCDTEVWEQPWTLTKEVTKLECNNKPNLCAGCPIEINKDNEAATKCLKRTLFNLNSRTGSGKKLSLHKIIRIQSQVVAGVKYTIEFEAFDQDKMAHSCKTVIISQPWLVPELKVADFQCTPISQ